MQRPDYDRSIRAFYPVINKEQNVFFQAEKTLNISRALSLQRELGFGMVLVEVQQGWPNLIDIKALGKPVLLSMNIPESEEEKKEEETDEKDADKKKDEIVDAEKEALLAKKKNSIREYQAQASVFEANDISFGFSYMDVKPGDVMKNVRAMIKEGLSEEQALRSLTTEPAQILGIQQMCGTIEKGKLANLIVSDQPIFAEKASLKYVFVDGQKFELKSKTKKSKASPDEASAVVGVWNYSIETPGETRTGNIKIDKDGEDFSGGISSSEAPDSFLDVDDMVVDGTNVSFSFTRTFSGQEMKFDVSISMDGDSFDGSFSNPMFGSIPISGSKVNDPKK
jgi:hypothetical protein